MVFYVLRKIKANFEHKRWSCLIFRTLLTRQSTWFYPSNWSLGLFLSRLLKIFAHLFFIFVFFRFLSVYLTSCRSFTFSGSNTYIHVSNSNKSQRDKETFNLAFGGRSLRRGLQLTFPNESRIFLNPPMSNLKARRSSKPDNCSKNAQVSLIFHLAFLLHRRAEQNF